MIRVVIVDDHPVVREGLATLLAGQDRIQVVAEAGDGLEAVTVCAAYHPDVVLMDLRMPTMDGATATRLIIEVQPEVKVLVLTTYDSDTDIVRAIEAGAISYLLKDTPRTGLVAAIHAAAEGRSTLAPQVASRLVRQRTDPADTAGPALTAREIDVLRLVAAGDSNTTIARLLGIGEATVKTHVHNVFRKLGVTDRTAAATAAIAAGLIPNPHAEDR
ncbi:response regulator [Longimycelium tulufanense]|uniref:response regulator n=1 Tax=Longimycelium tulufanense TaxID=907463 RepID=UPI00166D13A2|nr:response regulator transcription factor [Longimycelium tulufanense]